MSKASHVKRGADLQQRMVRRPGRNITVDGVRWRWRIGKGGGCVAYSETGERRCEQAWRIKGHSDPNTFGRGQWKKTIEGMMLPSEVAAWLSSNTHQCHPARLPNPMKTNASCHECGRDISKEMTWPGEAGHEICQDCWEAECSRSWWKMVEQLNKCGLLEAGG
mgnify:CR=1 FL=1